METEKRICLAPNLTMQRRISIGLLMGLPILVIAFGLCLFFRENIFQQSQITPFLTSSNAPQYPIIGNRKSRIYHWHSCPNYFDVAPNNQVVFATPEDAERRRFRPAENCSSAPPRSQTP